MKYKLTRFLGIITLVNIFPMNLMSFQNLLKNNQRVFTNPFAAYFRQDMTKMQIAKIVVASQAAGFVAGVCIDHMSKKLYKTRPYKGSLDKVTESDLKNEYPARKMMLANLDGCRNSCL